MSVNTSLDLTVNTSLDLTVNTSLDLTLDENYLVSTLKKLYIPKSNILVDENDLVSALKKLNIPDSPSLSTEIINESNEDSSNKQMKYVWTDEYIDVEFNTNTLNMLYNKIKKKLIDGLAFN
ncbi:hypothetical protein CCP3SC1AL1_1490007 [Gammaproteobacteria bacterium]